MNFLKKQSVAWVITLVMVIAAIGIGRARANTGTPAPGPAPSADAYYVYDNAGVLTDSEITRLSNLNRALMDDMNVVVACVTADHVRSDLYEYALDQAEKLGLRENDFIVVLDISGENYWLVQGAGLTGLFTDGDCADYARDYMEKDFARGRYGDALLSLANALSDWYYDHYQP